MECNIELDDTFMIAQAGRMHHSEMEPLYWKIEESICEGNTVRAKNLFSIIMYAAKYNKPLLTALRPTYKKRLKEIPFEFFSDYVPKRSKSITIKGAIDQSKLPFSKEFELQEYLANHAELLSEALKDRVEVTGIEVECGPEYRCDIVAESDTSFYPIELKIRQATHSVVSQCAKYCWYFYRQLRYGFYKDIQGVVISNGFCEWSVNELRRDGIWCFNLSAPDDELILKRI